MKNRSEPAIELVSLKIPKELHRRVKLEAVKQDVTIIEATSTALALWLREMRSVAK